jgi:NADH:ubiquinone oxidoreductase subunit 2 (chain N)
MDFSQLVNHPFFYPGAALFMVGLLFKIAAFPFHSWTPDVYTGAPTAVVGFMGTGSKMAAFITLSTFMYHAVPHADHRLPYLIAALALSSMIYGNVVAVQQTNIKRMLAFSSIAHTGYLLLGVLSGPLGYMSVVFYMIIYTFMTVGAFGIIAAVEKKEEDNELENWKGLGLRQPVLGAAMSIFMFSLAGMPPLAGFMGKYSIFVSAIKADVIIGSILGILTSVIGAYYYLRVIVYMYFLKPDQERTESVLPAGRGTLAGAVILSLVLLVLGVFPSLVFRYLDIFTSVDGLMTFGR